MSTWMVVSGEEKMADDARWLAKRPVCSRCGEPIQDEQLIEIDGELICLDCIRGMTKLTDNYIDWGM